ncbi:MAG: discoidin domain-containing protein, partial [Cyanothece sp. SIO2G6]|nr:discoidin domain-containing protein [Cyanothece sp. SIO2G6]
SFHTSFEDYPWWIVDLEVSVRVNTILVFNRKNFEARNKNLAELVSKDQKQWESVYKDTQKFGGVYDNSPLIIKCGDVLVRYIKILIVQENSSLALDEVEVLTRFPTDTASELYPNLFSDFHGVFYTSVLNNSGLGDQLLCLRVASIIAESMGMTFKGILPAYFDKIGERNGADNSMYDDIGLSALKISDIDHLKIIDVKMKPQKRGDILAQKSFYELLLIFEKKIKDAVSLQDQRLRGKENILIRFDVNPLFCDAFVKIFNHDFETRTSIRDFLRKNFLKRAYETYKNRVGSSISSSLNSKIKVLLHCRLGDVANIPVDHEGENWIIIPYIGAFRASELNQSNSSHAAFVDKNQDSLKYLQGISASLKDKLGELGEIYFITDGYDYSFDFLISKRPDLLRDFNLSEQKLLHIKDCLESDFKKRFFDLNIVYGESHDNLLASLILTVDADVVVSTNGHFLHNILMSFGEPDRKRLFIKKRFNRTLPKVGKSSIEAFWDEFDSEADVINYLDKNISSILCESV